MIYGGDKPSGIRIDHPPGSRHVMVTLTAGPDFSEADMATVQAKAAKMGVTAGEFVAQAIRQAIGDAPKGKDMAAAPQAPATATKVPRPPIVHLDADLMPAFLSAARGLGTTPEALASALLTLYIRGRRDAVAASSKPAARPTKAKPQGRSWIGVDLEPEIYEALEKRAKAAGMSTDDFFHLEMEQHIAALTGEEPPQPGTSDLHVLKKHATRLQTAADVLRIPVQTFLNWQMDSAAASLDDPQGLLGEYAIGGVLEFRTKAEAKKVRANYVRWLKDKGLDAEEVERITKPRLTDEEIDRVADHVEAMANAAA